MVTDGGMEFRGRFERGLEQHSVLQHTTHIQSPWQNGRAERHGQFVKSRLEMSMQSADSVVEILEDLEDLAIEIVTCKNKRFSRGGYSPAQLVYGRNPGLPSELLSDADLSSPGWADALCDLSGWTRQDTSTRGHIKSESAPRNWQPKQPARRRFVRHPDLQRIDIAFGQLGNGFSYSALQRERRGPDGWVLVSSSYRMGTQCMWR